MRPGGFWFDPAGVRGLLVDTNLLVLFVVGAVNRDRIEQFQRTRQYTLADYDLLMRVIDRFSRLYRVARVMAEVGNLTDLSGLELLRVRYVLREALLVSHEPEMPSSRAAEHKIYDDLGLADAAIASVARDHGCAVLTETSICISR